MAFDYDGTGDYSNSGVLYNDDAQVSVFMWCYIPASHGNALFDRIFELGGNTPGGGGIGFEWNDTSTVINMGVWNGGTYTASSVTITEGAWNSLGYTSDTTGPSNIAYHSGAQAHTNNGTTRGTTQSEFALAAEAGNAPGGIHTNIGLAEVAIWHGEIISAAEMASMDAGFSPKLVHPAGLLGYYSLIRTDNNQAGTGDSLTTGGTGGLREHPPVIYPAPSHIFTPPVVAGGFVPYPRYSLTGGAQPMGGGI